MAKRDCQGWHTRLMRRVVTVGFLFCLGPPGLQAADPPERGGGSPPPPPTLHHDTPSPPVADPLPDQTRLSILRTALNPLLVRDRRHLLLLTRGNAALREGRSLEGIAHLQALLDASQDAFFWTDVSPQPRGARADVFRQLQSLSEHARQDYEHLHGAIAHDLLLQYRESHDNRFLVELVRRFVHTAAARDAAVQQLLLARDTGRTAQASEWARLLDADPYHWQRLTPAVKRVVQRQLHSTRRSSISHHQRHGPDDGRVTQVVGYVGMSDGSTELSPPDLAPLWTVRFDADLPVSATDADDDSAAEDVGQIIRKSYGEWFTNRAGNRLPIASANEAIVAGEVLVVRDFTHVKAFDLHTGRILWKFRCESSLAKQATQTLQRSRSSSHAGTLDFHAHFTGNSVFGRLTTDGQHVYLLDKSDTREIAHDPVGSVDSKAHDSVARHARFPSRLIAFPVRRLNAERRPTGDGQTSVTPLWIRGARSGLADDDLAKHVMLGCPLCVDDRLFLLAESDGQVSLFALDSTTGRTLWKQGIALVERPVADDALRLRTACTALYHDGIVCCPTEVGVIVGVHALTGRLEWVYDHMDEEQRRNSGRWAFSNSRTSDRSLLPGHTFLQHGRLLHLPTRSRFVHCVDAKLGTALWTHPRLDAHAIGGVTASSVLLLGDRECRAISLADGSERWRTSIPEPAGTGIVMGDRYLLPTTTGPCLSLNLHHGQIKGRRFSQLLHELSSVRVLAGQELSSASDEASASHHPPMLSAAASHSPAGNLLAHEHLIIATTPLGVSVYPQAGHRLEQLKADANNGPLSLSDRLLQAQLLLTIEDYESAGDVLEEVLLVDHSGAHRRPTERLLREVLYAELDDAHDPSPLLDRITELARTDDERLRIQLSRVAVAMRCDDSRMMTDAVDEFWTLPVDTLISLEDDGESLVSARDCLRDRLTALHGHDRTGLREAMSAYVAREAEKLQETSKLESLERFVTLFGSWPSTAKLRTNLAQRWIAAGRLQDAELLLLSAHVSDGAPRIASTDRLLAKLYSRQGLLLEASQCLSRMTAQADSAPAWSHSLGGLMPKNVSLLTLHLTSTSPLSPRPPAQVRRTVMGNQQPLNEVQMIEHRCGEDCPQGAKCSCHRARALRENLRRSFVPRLSGSLVVQDQGIVGSQRTHSRLVLIDRDTGSRRGEVDVPSAYWQKPHRQPAEAGHVMVIGGEVAHGISLLEAKTLWSVHPSSSERTNVKFKIGPVGSDFCVLQSPHELRVIHPSSGRTLWQRTHLPPGIGLLTSESTGIIGDSQTLTVFDADGISYTVYRTASGRKIRQGSRKLAVGANRRNRWAVGRRLVEVVGDATGYRLCVWDSRDDRLTCDLPLRGRLVCALANETDFACVTADGRLQILNVATGDALLDLLLPDANAGHVERGAVPLKHVPLSAPTELTAFSDRDRFYINLRNKADGGEPGMTAATDELDVPHIRVRGRLLAIDRRDGRLLWDRAVPDACLPIRPETFQPVLTLLSRDSGARPGSGRSRRNDSTSLVLEVLDAVSGETLARQGSFACSRFVSCPITQAAGDPGESNAWLLSLVGIDSRIDVRCRSIVDDAFIRVATDDAVTIER